MLESPTGTGKTLCILSASLSYMYNEKMKSPASTLNKIVYLSRTHNQLKQVTKELKALPFNAKIATLASRMIYCMHSNFKMSGNDKCTAM
jgi:regulator of telomere elongation helicase 1